MLELMESAKVKMQSGGRVDPRSDRYAVRANRDLSF
jgi:hypothetical protein